MRLSSEKCEISAYYHNSKGASASAKVENVNYYFKIAL